MTRTSESRRPRDSQFFQMKSCAMVRELPGRDSGRFVGLLRRMMTK